MTIKSDPQLQHWSAQIRTAAARGHSLELRGGGSKSWYGQTIQGELLSTQNYAGIISYEPSELVLRAKAGTTVSAVRELLDQHGQRLAFEPPEFAGIATLGGMLASGLCGPGRYQSGPLRDFVLGVSILDGRGDFLQFGGQVMKNVAGYDVSRSHVGAFGSLGLVCNLTLKVLPKAETELSLVLQMHEREAQQKLQIWRQRWPVSASCWRLGRLYIRLSGYAETVQQARLALGGELLPDERLWYELREHESDFFTQNHGHNLWRIVLPPDSVGLGLPGKTLYEWGGQLQWLVTEVAPGQVHQAALARGAYATLYRRLDKTAQVFPPPAKALWRVQRALQQVFDPHRVFNRGRVFDDMHELERQPD